MQRSLSAVCGGLHEVQQQARSDEVLAKGGSKTQSQVLLQSRVSIVLTYFGAGDMSPFFEVSTVLHNRFSAENTHTHAHTHTQLYSVWHAQALPNVSFHNWTWFFSDQATGRGRGDRVSAEIWRRHQLPPQVLSVQPNSSRQATSSQGATWGQKVT